MLTAAGVAYRNATRRAVASIVLVDDPFACYDLRSVLYFLLVRR